MYLAWFDADRKKPVAMKIAEAHERYVAKFGRQPLVCLVNPEDAIPDATIALRPLSTIGRNCFWIGSDEDVEEEIQITPEPEAKPAPKRRARKPVTAPQTVAKGPETAVAREALSDTTVNAAAKPTRARKPRAVAQVEQPIPVQAPPAPVPTKRRPRRERPAA
jgi:hypothetical protein